MTESWLIFLGALTAYALCAVAFVIAVDGHHPITHLLHALRHLGGPR